MLIVRHSTPSQHDKAPHRSVCQVLGKPVTYYIQNSTDDEHPKWDQLDELYDKEIIDNALNIFN